MRARRCGLRHVHEEFRPNPVRHLRFLSVARPSPNPRVRAPLGPARTAGPAGAPRRTSRGGSSETGAQSTGWHGDRWTRPGTACERDPYARGCTARTSSPLRDPAWMGQRPRAHPISRPGRIPLDLWNIFPGTARVVLVDASAVRVANDPGEVTVERDPSAYPGRRCVEIPREPIDGASSVLDEPRPSDKDVRPLRLREERTPLALSASRSSSRAQVPWRVRQCWWRHPDPRFRRVGRVGSRVS